MLFKFGLYVANRVISKLSKFKHHTFSGLEDISKNVGGGGGIRPPAGIGLKDITCGGDSLV